MLDKITLLSLGIRPDTDPNNPETWSDELKINHKRTLKSLGSRSSDVAVKPAGSVSGKSGSFKPQTGKNLETGVLSGDDVRQESERIKTALSQIDNSDLEKDGAPKGVNSTVWGTASDKSKKLIKEYIKAHREFMARHQKNGQLPAESDLSDSASEDLEKIQDTLGGIQTELGEESYKRGERHPDPEGAFVVDPTKGKWYQEQTVNEHKNELGKVKSAQLFASSYPLGFTGYDRVPDGMDDVNFDELSKPIKIPNIKLKQASSQDLKQEQATAEAAAAVKKPQHISDDELDDMEEMDDAECDTCGEPAIGYDEEDGYQCKNCYKDTHGSSFDENEPEEESNTPVASSEPQGMPQLSSIKDDDASQYTPGPYETDIDKIKSQFAITSSSTARKDGTPDFIANYTNPEVPGHTKLAVNAMVSPNATGRPNPNGGRLYSINWGGDSVTLANGKNSTKLVGWGTGQFGKGIATGSREDEFNLAVHSVAKKIAEYHSKINGKLAGYTAPQTEEDSTPEINDDGSSAGNNYVSADYKGFSEHTRALGEIDREMSTHNKKSSGFAAVKALRDAVSPGGGPAFADTNEEEKTRITGLINQELTKHKKSSIMNTALGKIAKNLGYDLSASAPTIQERNQAETEAGSNISAQMTEAAAQSSEEDPQQQLKNAFGSITESLAGMHSIIKQSIMDGTEHIYPEANRISDAAAARILIQKGLAADWNEGHGIVKGLPRGTDGFQHSNMTILSEFNNYLNKKLPSQETSGNTSEEESWQSDDPYARDVAVTIDGKRIPYHEFLKQKTVPIPKINDSQRIMLYTKPAGEPAAPVGFQERAATRPKPPSVGTVKSEAIPKEQRFASNLRPANISEDHWNALGELGQQGKAVRSFVSMYAHKWHSIKDGETKYSLDQLKDDRDTITRFFTEKTGGNRESYDGSYLRSYRDLTNNISSEPNLGKGAYYDKARKSIAKDKETLGKLKSSFGELSNNGFADPKDTSGAYSPVTPEISKGIVDRVLSAYPMPE